jgi:hypothetical protein
MVEKSGNTKQVETGNFPFVFIHIPRHDLVLHGLFHSGPMERALCPLTAVPRRWLGPSRIPL